MATIKTGYDNALDFDPASGIIKYGQYEFFANQVVKPVMQTYTFDDYKKSLESSSPSAPYSSKLYGQTDEQLRAGFMESVQRMSQSGVGGEAIAPSYQTSAGTGFSGAITDQSAFSASNTLTRDTTLPSFVNSKQVDENTFQIERYDVPQDIEFVNRLNAEAANLNKNTALGQVTDASRPAGATGRLGKPNYSRAATVLAGQQSPLGGASTTLGS